MSNIVLPNSCILFQSVFNTDLTTIVSYIDRPYIIYGADSNKRTFTKNTYLKAKLYVPKGTIEKYKSTDGWKDFVNIIEGAGESSTIMNLNTNKMHIESEGNSIRISGLNSNTTIIVYNTAGHIIGSAKTQGEDIEIVTMLKKGEYGILKIGDRVVKVLMK